MIARRVPLVAGGPLGVAARRIRKHLGHLDESMDRRFLMYCANTPQESLTRVLSRDLPPRSTENSFWTNAFATWRPKA
jgi:hypothetical protein